MGDITALVMCYGPWRQNQLLQCRIIQQFLEACFILLRYSDGNKHMYITVLTMTYTTQVLKFSI
jgi:hypothetical protein